MQEINNKYNFGDEISFRDCLTGGLTNGVVKGISVFFPSEKERPRITYTVHCERSYMHSQCVDEKDIIHLHTSALSLYSDEDLEEELIKRGRIKVK